MCHLLSRKDIVFTPALFFALLKHEMLSGRLLMKYVKTASHIRRLKLLDDLL